MRQITATGPEPLRARIVLVDETEQLWVRLNGIEASKVVKKRLVEPVPVLILEGEEWIPWTTARLRALYPKPLLRRLKRACAAEGIFPDR